MGLDQYLHKVEKLSKYQKKDLKQGINKYKYKKMDYEGWSFFHGDDKVDPVIKKYGVCTQVERVNIDWKKMFNDYYPDVDYETVHLWHISGGQGYMVYGFGLNKEEKEKLLSKNIDEDDVDKINFEIRISIDEEKEKYEYYAYEDNWVYKSETIGQWRKAYHVREWMEDNIKADTDKDCWNFAMTKEQVMQLYEWSATYKNEEDEDIREEKEETYYIIKDNILNDKIDWDNEVICYYEWY